MGMGFVINLDLLGIHIHQYVHVPLLLWGIFTGLLYRWITGRIIKAWDIWYDKHPISHLVFHHHLKGHSAKNAWDCHEDGCKRVKFDDKFTYDTHHN